MTPAPLATGRGPLLSLVPTILLAAGAAAISGTIAHQVFGGIPHVTDGAAYLFQARIFAAGELTLEPPPFAELFAHEGVVVDAGGWHSYYSFGWPTLLALGWLAGAAWLVNPLLLALAVVGVAQAGTRLYDRTVGLAAALLMAVSPFALLMAASHLSHVATLCALAWALWALARAVERSAPRAMALAGSFGGVALVLRPPTALFCLLPLVAWALLRLRGRRLAAIGWAAAGVAPWLAAHLLYNSIFFGDLLRGGQRHRPAGHDFFAGSGVAEVIAGWWQRAAWTVEQLGDSLWGLPFHDLLLLVPLLLAARGRHRDAALAASAVVLVTGYATFSYYDVLYSGPRYAFEALLPLSLLGGRAWSLLRARLGGVAAGAAGVAEGASRRTARRAVAALAVAAFLWFPLGRRLPAQVERLSGWYLGVSPIPLEAGRRSGVGPDAVVFVGGTPWCYTIFFPFTSLHPQRGGRVYVRDVPPLRRDVLAALPHREAWSVRVVVRRSDPEGAPDLTEPVEVRWRRLR
jgi:hypothetical protein